MRGHRAIISPHVGELSQRIGELEARIAGMEGTVTELREAVVLLAGWLREIDARDRGPRDAQDVELLTTLRTLAAGAALTAEDFVARAKCDRMAHARLLEADVTDAAALGYVLRRCHGTSGLRRVGRG